MRFHCVACGSPAGDAYHAFCECGSMIDVEYDLARVRLEDSDNPYVRFGDLLPIASTRDRLPGDARFSPTIHAEALGAHLGLDSLYLKDETVLPTRSTKDRMAVVALGFLWERGVRSFCTSSTGNSSTSYARAIRAFPDMTLHLFTAEDFVERVQHADHRQVQHFGMRDASFVDAFNHAATYAARHDLVSERGFFNLGRREGLKTAFYEACDQVPGPIDWYVQAVSSAMGVYGTYKGAKELRAIGHIDRVPKLLCAQQETCAPLVRAYKEGSRRDRAPPRRAASARHRRGDPARRPVARLSVCESDRRRERRRFRGGHRRRDSRSPHA